ncbi:MAG TPA: hypothetical protein VHK88_18860, partial [Aquihabitans sp.]|nr:hypothetical protein [Aquihabitans sp.]
MATPWAAPPAPRRKPTGSKVLMILGLVLIVTGVLAATAGANRVGDAAEELNTSGDEVRNGLLLELGVPGSGEVDLEPGRYDVFALGGEGSLPRRTQPDPVTTDDTTPGTTRDTGIDEPVVVVTDPQGATVQLYEPSVESLLTGAFGELYAIESFTVEVAGSYRIDVTGSGTDATSVGVGPKVDTDELGNLVGGGALSLVGVLGGGLGFLLAVGGLIWFLVADTTPRPGPGGLYTPPPPGGGWAPPAPTAWTPPGSAPPPPPPPPPGPATWSPPPPPPAPSTWSPAPPPPPVVSPPPAAPWGSAPPTSGDAPRWSPGGE